MNGGAGGLGQSLQGMGEGLGNAVGSVGKTIASPVTGFMHGLGINPPAGASSGGMSTADKMWRVGQMAGHAAGQQPMGDMPQSPQMGAPQPQGGLLGGSGPGMLPNVGQTQMAPDAASMMSRLSPEQRMALMAQLRGGMGGGTGAA